MPIFRYKWYKQDGKETSGSISAESIRDAKDRLKSSGLLPSEIEVEGTTSGTGSILNFRKSVGLPELALATRRLATLVGASMPLFEAVATLMDQEQPGEMRSVLSRVKEKLAEGKGLAAALSARAL